MCQQQAAAVHGCHIVNSQPDNLVMIYQFTEQTLKLTGNIWDSTVNTYISLFDVINLSVQIQHVNLGSGLSGVSRDP